MDVNAVCPNCNENPLPGDVFCGGCGDRLPETISADPSGSGPAVTLSAVPAGPIVDPLRKTDDPEGDDQLQRPGESVTPDDLPHAGRWRRPALILVCAAAVVAVLATFAVVLWPADSPARPGISHSTKPSNVPPSFATLPGWASRPAWQQSGVADAVLSPDGSALAVLKGLTVTVIDPRTGKRRGSSELAGSRLGLISGDANGESAVVAYSSTTGLVWVGGATDPWRFELSGGELLVRTGTLMILASDGTYSLVGHTGLIPVVSPRPRMIPLGRSMKGVLWGSARGSVISAAVNGAILGGESTLALPVPGATVTGWIFTTTAPTADPLRVTAGAIPGAVVVTWTYPDGTKHTTSHDANTGALMADIPAPTAASAVVSASGTSLVASGYWINVTTGVMSPLPTGFVPTQFLGAALYGATSDGSPAVLVDGKVRTSPTPTVTPTGTDAAGDLVTLTGGHLRVFRPIPTSRPTPGGTSAPLNTKETTK